MYTPQDKNFDLKIYEGSKTLYEYEDIEATKVIAEGFWRGRHFVIGKNWLCVPVVYVEWHGKYNFGGEYLGEAYWLPKDQRDDTLYYGWDHGHISDYSPRDEVMYNTNQKGKHRWQLTEMLMEIAEFIERAPGYEQMEDEEE